VLLATSSAVKTYYKSCSELLQILPLPAIGAIPKVLPVASREWRTEMTNKHWNAGDAGCGSLIVGLKRQLEQMKMGELLRVTAHSAGAPADIPAWCRMTGHSLVESNHPDYVFEKTTTDSENTA
jgi:tRNA 2-thiouridine synthesizing protein A